METEKKILETFSLTEAQTWREINIHLSNIREKIDNNRYTNDKNFQDLKEQITLQSHSFVLMDDFKQHQKESDDHEARIRALQANSVTKAEQSLINNDHELRTRRLEYWGAVSIGGLYVMNFALGLLMFYLNYKK